MSYQDRLLKFLEMVQEKFDNGINKNKTTGQYTISVEPGRKYDRIVITNFGNRSAFGFVNRENGDVLKSASWKTPAKNSRGNIYNEDFGTTRANWPSIS